MIFHSLINFSQSRAAAPVETHVALLGRAVWRAPAEANQANTWNFQQSVLLAMEKKLKQTALPHWSMARQEPSRTQLPGAWCGRTCAWKCWEPATAVGRINDTNNGSYDFLSASVVGADCKALTHWQLNCRNVFTQHTLDHLSLEPTEPTQFTIKVFNNWMETTQCHDGSREQDGFADCRPKYPPTWCVVWKDLWMEVLGACSYLHLWC